ncbi:hypothetical protein F5Y13DRAFT_160003 [Hypoxylon sp. FL1857]|nr:hypothetical protein F5Y13DRAFT_160003 [Hypoxylon sp. FL1857]
MTTSNSQCPVALNSSLTNLSAMEPTVEGRLLANTSSHSPPHLAQLNARLLPSTVPSKEMHTNSLARGENSVEVISSLKAEVSSLQESLRVAHTAMDDMLADLSSTQERLELEERSSRNKDLKIREWQGKVETLENLLHTRSKPQLPSAVAESHTSVREPTEISELKARIKGLESSLKDQASANENRLETERAWKSQLHDQKRNHQFQIDQLEAKVVEQERRRREAETRETELQDSQTMLERQLAALQRTSIHMPQGDSKAHEVEELRRLVDFYKANSEKASLQAQEAFAMRSSGIQHH